MKSLGRLLQRSLLLFGLLMVSSPTWASPIQAEWVSDSHSEVKARVLVRPEGIEPCLFGGLDLEHRVLLRACDASPGWLNTCSDERKVIQRLVRDPIQETYTVWKDRLGDDEDPKSESYEELEDGTLALLETDPISRVFIGFEEEEHYRYIEIRSIIRCKGEYGDFFRNFSYLLSFGLLDLDGSDTGWIPFEVDE